MEGEERAVVPGLFQLQVPINTVENIDKVLTAKLRDLRQDLQARLERPAEELAILNLLGLLSFRIRDHESALDHFEAVLAKDPENLNALANMQFVMKRLYRMAEAQSCKDRQEDLLQLGDAPSDERLKHRCRLKARCLAEQGYACACDIYVDRYDENRNKKANSLFEDALELAGDLVEPSEKDSWKFCMATNARKIVDFLAEKQKFVDAVKYLREAETLFYELTQSTSANSEYKWESWRGLANIIRVVIKRREFQDFAFRPELKDYKENPEKCMVRAMEISPDNPNLLVRYANFVYSLKQKDCFQRAMDLLDQSIEIDSSENNFYAFSTRAQIAYEHYKFHLAKFKQGSSKHHPAVRHLENAKRDFDTALCMRDSPWHFASLGEVYYLLSKHPEYAEQGSKVVRQHFQTAMSYFTKAVSCQDGERLPEVRRMWGQCLFDMGEYETAKECFLKAVECEPKSSQFSGNSIELLRVYLQLLKQEMPKALEDWSLLLEMLDKLKSAQVTYGGDLEKRFISTLKSEYLTEIQMIAEYCQRFPQYADLNHLLTSVTRPQLVASTEGTLE